MSIDKKVIFNTIKDINNEDVICLNKSAKWEIVGSDIVKTASIDKIKNANLGGFDIESAIKDSPEHLFVKVFAIKQDEVNDNGDYFSASELKKAAHTFVGVPVFVNHQNNDIEKARGKVVHAWYDEKAGGIYIISKVDKTAYPKLARGIEEEIISGTSMGCFPYDAKVLMSDGTEKNISEVKKGDYVISHTGESRKVLNVQIHEDKTNDIIFEIRARCIKDTIRATKEHPFLVLKEQPFCRITGDYLGLPKNRYNKYIKRAKLGSYQMESFTELCEKDSYETCWKEAKDLNNSDILVFPVKKEEGKNVDLKFARLCGLFLAEGNFSWYNNYPAEIQMTFSLSEKDTLVKDALQLLSEVFPKDNPPRMYVRTKKNTCDVRLASKEACNCLFNICGSGAKTKKLSEDVFSWSKESVLALIGGWIDGDGCRRRIKKRNNILDNYCASTLSQSLAQQIVYLSRLHGIKALIDKRKATPGFIKQNDIIKEFNRSEYYSISYSSGDSKVLSDYVHDSKKIKYKSSTRQISDRKEDYLLFPINSITKKMYDKEVFNLEIEEDNSFIVNGVAVHNCSVAHSCCSICHNKASVASDFCFTGNTPILMSDFTVKNISEIQIGDEVIDADGKPTKVVHLFSRQIKEKVIILKSRAISGEIVCTKNHPFLVNARGEYRYFPSEYLKDQDVLYTPIPVINRDNSFFDKYGFSDLDKEQKINLCRFLGLYAAEGSRVIRDKEIRAIELTFNKNETDYINFVVNFSKNVFGINPQVYTNAYTKNTARVRIFNKDIAQKICNICTGVVRTKKDKKFDKSIFTLENIYISEIVSGMIDGDGHEANGGQIVFVGAADGLVSQFYYMLVLLGASPSMNYYMNSGGPFNRDKQSKINRVSIGNSQVEKIESSGIKIANVSIKENACSRLKNVFTDDGLYMKHSLYSVDESDYSGYVYNFETESNSYVANNTAVHNCSHVKERKNKKFSGQHECKYHDSPDKPEDDCPVCGKKKSESKTNQFKEAKVFEHNYGIKFIEDSFVVNPACHDCLVCDVLNLDKINEYAKHASEQKDLLLKAANNSGIIKVAGQKEIDYLNEAINKIERVARSMMAQKAKVQLDYVSDLVESMSDIQNTLDELVQMGYAQLPSPTTEEIAFGANAPASTVADSSVNQTAGSSISSPETSSNTGFQPAINTTQNAQQPAQQHANNYNPQAQPLGEGIGTITKPSFSAAASISREDFLKHAYNIKDDLQKIEVIMKDFKKNADFNDHISEYNKICESFDNNYKVMVVARNDGEIKVAEFKDNVLIRISNSEVYDKETQFNLIHKPEKVAENILQQLTKESDSYMASQEKIAGKSESSEVNVTTEAQLESSKNPIVSRKGDAVEGITESDSQLGGKEKYNDTTSKSPQVRKDATYETITEDQLSSIKEGYVVRWNEFPEVITEGQWEEVNRAVGSVLPSDWSESITQKQLLSFRENHSWVDPEFITEKQLEEGKKGVVRQASSDPKKMLKIAISSVANAIYQYRLTPSQIKNAVAKIFSNPHSQIKASRMVLLNSVPRILEARKNENEKSRYFSKVASKESSMNALDGIICSMADCVGCLKADNIVEAVKFVVSDDRVMKKAEQEALDYMNNDYVSNDHVKVDSLTDSLKNAFAEMEKSDDGIYKVCGSIKDDLDFSDINDSDRFIKSVEKFVFAQVPSSVVLTNLDIDEENGVFEAIVKEPNVLTAEEKDALVKVSENNQESNIERSAKRETILKEAQMMGGQLGGGMGGGGTPPPGPSPSPAANQPPIESFTEETDPMDSSEDSSDMTSKPPGAVCPACGSEDVDVASGKNHCNNCGLDFIVKVDIEALNWPGIIDDGQGEKEETGDKDKGLPAAGEGEGFPMPSKEEPASLPVAASTKLNKNVMLKLASMNVNIGDVSPITGSNNTIKLSDNEFMCLDTGRRYNVVLKGGTKNSKDVYAEWRWVDRTASLECDSCEKQKESFVKALNSIGVKESDFDMSSAMDKAKTILAMNDKGLLKQIKVANKNSSVLSAFKTAYAIDQSKFPVESCMEKIARRFGENAVAISGPCEGSNLADCVCNKLKTAGFYSDQLAMKVASIWSDQDGTVECWEDYIRSGLSAKQAAVTCECLRRKYSQAEHMLADELGSDTDNIDSVDNNDIGIDNDSVGLEEDGLLSPETDPFSDINENSSSNISLDVLEALKNLNESIISHLEKSDTTSDNSVDVTDVSDTEVLPENSSLSEDEEVSDLPADSGDSSVTDGTEDAPVMDGSKDVPSSVEAPSAEIEISVDSPEDNSSLEGSSFDGAETPKEEDNKEGKSIVESGEDTVKVDVLEDEPSKCDCPCSEETEEHENEENENKENDTMEKEGKDTDNDASKELAMKEAESMRKGRIVANHKVNLDVSSILKVLNKKADQSSLKTKNVQDVKEIAPISNGKSIGNEESFKADKPKVPEAGKSALMGKEDKNLHPGDSKPSVFTGNANMGKEKEQGYTSEKTDEQTGGIEGAGKSASSTRNIMNGLADRIVSARTKIANEQKIDSPKPVSEDSDLGKISTEKDGKKVDIPEKGEGSFVGHEKEVLESVPKADNSAPSIPVGGDNKEKNYDAEKQTHIKGTAIASSNEKIYLERKSEATKLAGRLIENGIIDSSQLMSKIAELERYDVSQIKDLEKAMFASKPAANLRKGLEAVANGSEKAVVIAESSKFNKPEDELRMKLQSLFSLQKDIDAAENEK